jgi:hypothetical protein
MEAMEGGILFAGMIKDVVLTLKDGAGTGSKNTILKLDTIVKLDWRDFQA